MNRKSIIIMLMMLCVGLCSAQTIRNTNNSKIAKIDTDGTVRNNNNSTLRIVEADGTVRFEGEHDIHSIDGIKQRLSEILTEALRMSDKDAINTFFTEEFKYLYELVEKFDNEYNTDCPGFWNGNIWDGGQDSNPHGFTINSISSSTETEAYADVKFSYDIGEYHSATYRSVSLVFENGNWYIDDINGCKAEMKGYDVNETTYNGIFSMVGHVSQDNIHMNIEIDNTSVKGRYCFDSQGSSNQIRLEGMIDVNGNMELTTYGNDEEAKGYFSGTFDGSTYSGQFVHNSTEEHLQFSVSVEESVETDPAAAIEFLQGMYKDYYNTECSAEEFLSKHFTKEAMQKCLLEDEFTEGEFYYDTGFLLRGVIGGKGDYGNKIISRTIVPENDDWFLVTNVWDIVQTPLKIHLQVKSVDGEYKIVDLREDSSCNNELFTLEDCPQEIDGLVVELSQSEDDVQTIRIFKDGKFFQELVGENFHLGFPNVFDKSILFFVDANYDGETDIFIGGGFRRTSNTILLWNPKNNMFERYDSHDFQNVFFSPSENAIYELYGINYLYITLSKSVWENGELKETEYIVEIFDIKYIDEYNEYSDFKVNKKYTLFDKNKNILTEADSIEDLPNYWKAVMKNN